MRQDSIITAELLSVRLNNNLIYKSMFSRKCKKFIFCILFHSFFMIYKVIQIPCKKKLREFIKVKKYGLKCNNNNYFTSFCSFLYIC